MEKPDMRATDDKKAVAQKPPQKDKIKPLLHSVGSDATSYQGNRQSCVIIVESGQQIAR
jgi:hypothetical protein